MCAIIGLMNASKAAERAMAGLHAMQHRAIDYAGIVTTDGQQFYEHRGAGIARQVFLKRVDGGSEIVLDRLHGRHAIGHLRYPTVTDRANRLNIQPIEGLYKDQKFYLAHNGNLTNREELIKQLPGLQLATDMDTELIVRLLERQASGDVLRDLGSICSHSLSGSYSLVLLFADRLIAVRDPSGCRPLSLARDGSLVVVASETCAFETLGLPYVTDVKPGTIVEIRGDSADIDTFSFAKAAPAKCLFELVYFAHPTSHIFDHPASTFRQALGEAFERHAPVEADLVVGVPDSGTAFAVGWGRSGRSGRFVPAIIRNHYVGRTFIAANQALRDIEVAQKFQFDIDALRGKRVVLLDDSIVRLTTLPKVVARVRAAGAREVHGRIAFPPVRYPCHYGINTPTHGELAAANFSTEELRQKAGLDSLEYFKREWFDELIGADGWCTACISGERWDTRLAA